MRENLTASDLRLVVLRHRFEVRLVSGTAEDILDVDIVHRPRGSYKASDNWSACGHDFALRAHAVVDRKVLNTRNVRHCRHQACFGNGR